MKKEITKYKYIKQKIEGFEVDLPEEPIYLFEFGYRVAYAIIPKWTTWNKKNYDKPEEVFQYNVTVIDPSLKTIEAFDISVSQMDDSYARSKENGGTTRERALRYLIDGWQDRQVRSREQFLSDFNNLINELKTNILITALSVESQ